MSDLIEKMGYDNAPDAYSLIADELESIKYDVEQLIEYWKKIRHSDLTSTRLRNASTDLFCRNKLLEAAKRLRVLRKDIIRTLGYTAKRKHSFLNKFVGVLKVLNGKWGDIRENYYSTATWSLEHAEKDPLVHKAAECMVLFNRACHLMVTTDNTKVIECENCMHELVTMLNGYAFDFRCPMGQDSQQ